MAIFTFDQVVKKAGVKPTDVTSVGNSAVTPPTDSNGYIHRVINDTANSLNTRADQMSKENATASPVEQGVQKAGTALGLALDTGKAIVDNIPGVKPVENAIGAGVDWLSKFSSPVKMSDGTTMEGNPVKALGDLIGGTKSVQDAVSLYDSDPNFKQTVDSSANIVNAILQGKAAVETGTAAVGKVADITGAVTDKVASVASDLKGSLAPKAPTGDLKVASAIQDATPNYETSTTKQRQKLLPRVQEGGTLNGRTVTPTALETEAGTELAKIPGYDPKATKLAKYQLAKKEVTNQATKLETDLGKEKIIVPKKEIVSAVRTAVDAVPEESLLLQKSDPAIRNYMRVVNNAASESEGTLKGVLNLRKKLDAAYENARGSQAFGSDKIAALDEVHKAGRNALTQYLIDKAQKTTVKASLRSQWNLYRALDELQVAAEKEAGSTVGRLMQKHPVMTKAVEMGAKATGLGGAVNLIK